MEESGPNRGCIREKLSNFQTNHSDPALTFLNIATAGPNKTWTLLDTSISFYKCEGIMIIRFNCTHECNSRIVSNVESVHEVKNKANQSPSEGIW